MKVDFNIYCNAGCGGKSTPSNITVKTNIKPLVKSVIPSSIKVVRR